MSSVVQCSRRLLRPGDLVRPTTVSSSVAAVAAFSTTTTRAMPPPNQKKNSSATAGIKGHIRGGKQVQTKRNKRPENASRGRPVAPGERKLFRKRIVLSNNNALPVETVDELTKDSLADAAQTGQVVALPDAVVDQLRSLEAFKATQRFPLFRRPSVLVRRETVELVGRLQKAAGMSPAVEETAEAVEAEAAETKKEASTTTQPPEESKATTKEMLRLLIDGPRVSGKSILLLQAMTYGLLNNWLVMHIPEELTNGNTDYAPFPALPGQYIQTSYILRTLHTFLEANSAVLEQYKTVASHEHLASPVPAGASLRDLIAAAKESEHAWPVLQSFLAEMRDTSVPRPPFLLAVDGVDHVMRKSVYRTPDFQLIHAHDLVFVRVLVDFLNGQQTLPHGGAILAATSRNNMHRNLALELALEPRSDKTKAIQAPAYAKDFDARTAAALQTVDVLRVQGVDQAEARALLEYWAASGLLQQRVDAKTVTSAWSVAGNGVVGEMERSILSSLRV